MDRTPDLSMKILICTRQTTNFSRTLSQLSYKDGGDKNLEEMCDCRESNPDILVTWEPEHLEWSSRKWQREVLAIGQQTLCVLIWLEDILHHLAYIDDGFNGEWVGERGEGGSGVGWGVGEWVRESGRVGRKCGAGCCWWEDKIAKMHPTFDIKV